MNIKRYNINLKGYVEINEGEEICPKCDGKGRVKLPNGKGRLYSATLNCDKCLGAGKIDWVEKATGKKVKHVYGFER
jgi:DnaJ-class molecular chaperone